MNDAPFPWRDVGQLGQRDLLAVGRSHQQIADFLGAAAELGLHADHQVEQLFSLDDLGDSLAADCGLDHRFHVGDIDSITRNLVAIDINQQAGLAEFAHYRQIGKAGHVGQDILDLHGLVLKDVQIVAIDLDRQRTLQTGQRLVHRIFRGLGVVEDDSRKGAEFLVDGGDQLFLVADLAVPGFVVVRTAGRHRTRN